ncbi:VanZ family protein [Periweissella cryptocerci]|nr:VanZ family protein [Periweissella cryptocerci]
MIIFSFYITKVMSMTMLPIFIYHFWYVGDMFGFGQQVDFVHLNPVRAFDYFPSWFWFEQFFGNFIMLTPFGIMAPYVFPRLRKLWQVGLLAFGVSLSIETYQFVFSYFYITARYFETSDLILNTTGALIGFGIWRLVMRHSQHVHHLYEHRLANEPQYLRDLFNK